jgi:hypothetical protein
MDSASSRSTWLESLPRSNGPLLMQKRNDLSEELEAMNTRKEKSFQEFEQLSMKNAQLADKEGFITSMEFVDLCLLCEMPRPLGLG